MSWEEDFQRGSEATKAPVLYAVENMSEQLAAVEGKNVSSFIRCVW